MDVSGIDPTKKSKVYRNLDCYGPLTSELITRRSKVQILPPQPRKFPHAERARVCRDGSTRSINESVGVTFIYAFVERVFYGAKGHNRSGAARQTTASAI